MSDNTNAVRSLFERYYWDPLAFCMDMFPAGEQPREWQPEVLEQVKNSPWMAIAACRKAGKTRLAAFLVLWFMCTRANSLVVTIAPVWSQVIQVLWPDVRHLWTVSKLAKIFPTWQILSHEIQTHPMTPKWRAYGMAASDVQNLEGRHPQAGQPTLVICDESKAIGDAYFDSAQGMLSEGQSMLLAIGTPGVPVGWFYRAFTKDRQFWQYTKKVRADEIPRLAAKCVSEQERLGENDPFFRQQWLAEFTGADSGAVIPLRFIEMAIERKFEYQEIWKKLASLDVAGGGSSRTADENVLTLRHGPVIIRQIAWQGTDEMQTASRAASEATQYGATAVIVDEIGIGAGVRSRVRELLKPAGIQCFGFNAGRSARDKERFANIKAEEVFSLRGRFLEEQVSIPNVPQLIGQLCSWTTDFTPTGKTKIVDPEDSPDYADSCMMAFAADRLGQSVRGTNPQFLR